MATKYVTYCTKTKLDCGFTPSAQVILCVQDSALIVQPEPLCGLDLTTLIATICSAATLETGCQSFTYQYTFSYSDTQITDPATRPLIASDITGVICEGCLTDWIMQQISCIGGQNCVEDSDSIDFSLTADDCITGDVLISADANNKLSLHADGLYATGASILSLISSNSIALSYPVVGSLQADSKISANAGNQITINVDGLFVPAGGGGSGWSLTGDAGTVDGTNFLGTTDNIPMTIRVNNLPAFRFDSGSDSSSVNITGNPDGLNIITSSLDCLIGAGVTNEIAFSFACNILGGGYGAGLGVQGNHITGVLGIENNDCTIAAGYSNTIQGGSSACLTSGRQNLLDGGFASIVVGKLNLLSESDTSFMTGASNEISDACAECSVSGNANTITSFCTTCSVSGGTRNLITGINSYDSSIGGGTGSSITESFSSFIGGGDTNSITGNADNHYANVIGGGYFNSITATLFDSILCFIGGGNSNAIDSDESSVVCGGELNTITGGSYGNFIGGGALNNIIGNASNQKQSILGGEQNVITTSKRSIILGGAKNFLTNAPHSAILGGAQLTLGATSIGFQKDPGVNVQRDVSAFPSIAFLGDIDLWIGNTDSTARKIKFFEPNAVLDYSTTNYSSFQAQAQGANIEYIWPSAAGTAGQQLTIDTVVGTVITLKWA